MGQMGDIRRGLAERIAGLPDFEGYPFMPDAINVPCAWVEPDSPFVNYQVVFAGGATEWRFLITILSNRQDEESGQEILDEYLSPDGLIVGALQARGVGDLLDETAQYVNVISASRYGSYKVGGTHYFGVQLSVEVRA